METHMKNTQLYTSYNLEQIFRDALYNQLDVTLELEDYLEVNYQTSIYSTFSIVGMWLGKSYDVDWKRVHAGLEAFSERKLGLNLRKQVLYLPMQKIVLCVFFPITHKNKYRYFQRIVQSEWSLFAPECSVFFGERCSGISNFPRTLELIISQLDWNLVMGPRVLIHSEQLNQLHITPLKYLSELDGELEKALLQKDIQKFNACFYKLKNYVLTGSHSTKGYMSKKQIAKSHSAKKHITEVHTPEAIKAVFLRYALVIAHVSRINGGTHTELDMQHMVKTIANAHYWSEIWEAIHVFAVSMLTSSDHEKTQSLLVIEAKKLILQYFTVGITLEEVADKLHISEEYLSTIFKKETGSSFSETMRLCRIEHAKQLLTTSTLRINEIAHLSGYSDGKYMSRVFKESVGMRPNEYRKIRTD